VNAVDPLTPGVPEDRSSALLEELQDDFPLHRRPFRLIGGRCGLSEAQTLRAVREMLSEGLIREIAALLDGRALGYGSTLVALRAPEQRIETVVERINRHRGVSHNYLRDHRYNIWFTLSVPREQDLAGAVQQIVDGAAAEILILPALHTFKLRVHLPVSQQRRGRREVREEGRSGSEGSVFREPEPLSAFERILLARLENPLPPEARPWTAVASGLAVTESRLFAAVKSLKARGVIRRISAVLRHREVGFTANAMACFRVSGQMQEAGRKAASNPAVSHCYLRKSYPQWPYSLYAMIHARSREECEARLREISRAIGCPDHQILYSLREFKKQRIKYFEE
jgi:DNA-binding Lrp family transcriptional regulator